MKQNHTELFVFPKLMIVPTVVSAYSCMWLEAVRWWSGTPTGRWYGYGNAVCSPQDPLLAPFQANL